MFNKEAKEKKLAEEESKRIAKVIKETLKKGDYKIIKIF